MLKINPETDRYVDPAQVYDQAQEFNISQYWRVIRSNWPLVAWVAAAVVGLAIVYLLVATPKFTATATILIDTHKVGQLFEKQQVVADAPMDAFTVESQVEVVKSESVLLSVINSLKLTEDPEFNGSDASFIQIAIGTIMALFDNTPSSEERVKRNVVDLMSRNLTVKRVGLTYVVTIDYTSKSPTRAKEVANAVADAYMVTELDAKYQATRRASKWLQDRIKELRTQATAADEAVRNFKAENNLVDTSRGLMSQQQLTDVNTQLVQAQAATAEAKAKLDRVVEVSRNNDVTDANITDALKSDVISRLRAQYLDLAAKEADWSTRYGAQHTAAVNLRNQMREIRRSISDEVKRIAEAYSSDYKIALAREQSLQDSLNKLVGESAGTGKAQVQLRDLESTAQTYRNLYDNFLQRSSEATQQQSFPVSEVRIITEATVPLKKSSPKTLLILAGSTVVGLFLGLGTVFARERLDNVFRSGAQIEESTGLACLGTLPKVSTLKSKTSLGPGRELPAELGMYRYVTEAPFSRFAETLRSLKVAVNIGGLSGDTRLLGFVSAVPNEGKTTVAANFAALLAQSGNRTLLIDCDLRHPSLSRALVGRAEHGLLYAIENPNTVPKLVWRDPRNGLEFLAAETNMNISHTSELLSSNAMARLLESVQQTYEFVILDLPPIVPVVDVKAISHLVDKFVLVVEWGKTTKEVVSEALGSVEIARQRMLGVILNKADPASLKRLEMYRGRYYNKYYNDERSAA